MSLYQHSIMNNKKYNTPIASILNYHFPAKVTGLKFGLEIEMENTGNVIISDNFTNYWVRHEDNSLRNHGVEFVTRGNGVTKEIAFEALDHLDGLLKSYPTIDFSERTSFHVHMNFQDRTVKDFHNFLTIYYMFENLLTLRAGFENRVANLFCLRIVDANAVKKSMIQSFQKHLEFLFQHEKYLGLNLSAYTRFGTLEVRVHRGTHDVEEYKRFIDALEEIYTVAMSLSSPSEIFYGMSALGFVEYFDTTFPITMQYLRNDPQKLIDRNLILSEFNQAMVFCQGLANAIQVSEKNEESIKKKDSSIRLTPLSITRIWPDAVAYHPEEGFR